MKQHKRSRLLSISRCGFLSAFLAVVQIASAQAPTDKPFLWRIEGTPPSYLYGTLDIPDERVLALPDVVKRAFGAADVFNAEIPMDDATRQAALALESLPGTDQNLRSILGDEVFLRIVTVIGKFLPEDSRPLDAFRLAATLTPLKPGPAMLQMARLQFLRDVAEGRVSLDEALYGMAVERGKTPGGLETIGEHAAIFEPFTSSEQIRMLVAHLSELEKAANDDGSSARKAVEAWLAGDLDGVTAQLARQFNAGDPALTQKLMKRIGDDRSVRMAERIAERCAGTPARSYFFAVSVAHFGGDTGIISQLTKKGLKVTRLGPADAASIVRKPAA